jgi:hypothetical protein
VIDDGFSFQYNPIGFIFCISVIVCWNYLIQPIAELFLCHYYKLLCIVDSLFYVFYLAENLIFCCRHWVFFRPKTITYPINFIHHVKARLNYYDKCSVSLKFQRIVGNVERINDAVLFSRSKDHLCKFKHILCLDYSWNIGQGQFVHCFLIENSLCLSFLFSSLLFLAAKYLSTLKQKIFVVFEIGNFNFWVGQWSYRLIQSCEGLRDISFDGIDNG